MGITKAEALNKIREAQIYNGNNALTQIKNANASLDVLAELEGLDDATANQYKTVLSGQKVNGIMSGALAGVSGLTNIINTAGSLGSIQDQTAQKNLYQSISDLGKDGYGSFNQAILDYNNYGNLKGQVNTDYDSIRDMNTGQKIGNVANAALSGGSAGMAIAGPAGAAVGAGIGALIGAGGWAYGDKAANLTQNINTYSAKNATMTAQANMSAGVDALKEQKANTAYANRRATGGTIKRQLSLQEFAERMKNNLKFDSSQFVSPVVRTHGEGGTIIRIKRH